MERNSRKKLAERFINSEQSVIDTARMGIDRLIAIHKKEKDDEKVNELLEDRELLSALELEREKVQLYALEGTKVITSLITKNSNVADKMELEFMNNIIKHYRIEEGSSGE